MFPSFTGHTDAGNELGRGTNQVDAAASCVAVTKAENNSPSEAGGERQMGKTRSRRGGMGERRGEGVTPSESLFIN